MDKKTFNIFNSKKMFKKFTLFQYGNRDNGYENKNKNKNTGRIKMKYFYCGERIIQN